LSPSHLVAMVEGRFEAVRAAQHDALPLRRGRLLAAGASLLLVAGPLALLAHGDGGLSRSVFLYSQNPATRPSDDEQFFPARQYVGGALSGAEFPPQCPRGGSGDYACVGLAHHCAQCMDGSGHCFPRDRGSGTIQLTKTDGLGTNGDYYFLNVEGKVGHDLAVILRSTDGYSREWEQVGSLWTGKIHQPCAKGRSPAAVDLVQVTDGTTGEMAFFRFPCEGSVRCTNHVETPYEGQEGKGGGGGAGDGGAEGRGTGGPEGVDWKHQAGAVGDLQAPPFGGGGRGGGGGGGRGAMADRRWPGTPGPHPPSPFRTATPSDCSWTYWPNLDWGSMPCGFGTCSSGVTQSPIDISIDDLEWTGHLKQQDGQQTIGWWIPPDSASAYVNYVRDAGGDTADMLYTDQKSFQVEGIAATMSFHGVVYTFQYFRLHTLSEHTFDGKHYDVEMQFVHTTSEASAEQKSLIVSAFFKVATGHGSPTFMRKLISALPELTDSPKKVVAVDFAEIAQTVMIGSLLHRGETDRGFTPNFQNYFAYQGSITTPPCTQGVQWILLRNPIFIFSEDFQSLHALLGNNYRPVQPLNGREVIATVI